MFKLAKSFFSPLTAVLFLFLSTPVPGAESAEPLQQGHPAEVTPQGSLAGRYPVAPVESELSPQALETYAYLVFIQSIFNEDETGLLEAAPIMAKNDTPASIWLDGGLWLMGRKSPNAVAYLELAVKAHPDDMSLNLLYADALGDHGMAEAGENLMREYLKKHPDSLDARIELALLLVKNKKFDEARKILDSISAKDRHGLVNYYQARALIGMGKPAEAIPWLRKAVKEMPEFEEGWKELAVLLEREGNFREARNAYEKLQKLNYSPQEVGLNLVNLSLKLKQPEKAVQYVRQGPDTLAFKISAAKMLMDSGHYLQVENILKQIASKQDAPLEVYLWLADLVFAQRRNLGMALSWLDKIPPELARDPKVALVRIQLTAEAGKTAEALKLADQSVEQYPDSADAATLRIQLLAKDKKKEQARLAAAEAYKKWPLNPGISFIYGSLLDEAGQKKEALEVMENLAKTQPDNYQALNYIGYTLAEENRDLGRALELLKKANELAPNQSYIVDSLAWALFRAGQYEEALKEIKRAINLDSGADAAIWEHYGDIAARNGRKDEARKAYRKAIELKPANAAEVKNKLSAL